MKTKDSGTLQRSARQDATPDERRARLQARIDELPAPEAAKVRAVAQADQVAMSGLRASETGSVQLRADIAQLPAAQRQKAEGLLDIKQTHLSHFDR